MGRGTAGSFSNDLIIEGLKGLLGGATYRLILVAGNVLGLPELDHGSGTGEAQDVAEVGKESVGDVDHGVCHPCLGQGKPGRDAGGWVEVAADLLTVASALAQELHLREETAFILSDLGGGYMEAGQIERARMLLDEARSLWRELDNRPMLADTLMLSGVHAMLIGDFDQALLFTDEGLEISKSIGNLMGQESNQGSQIGIWMERGDFAKYPGVRHHFAETADAPR